MGFAWGLPQTKRRWLALSWGTYGVSFSKKSLEGVSWAQAVSPALKWELPETSGNLRRQNSRKVHFEHKEMSVCSFDLLCMESIWWLREGSCSGQLHCLSRLVRALLIPALWMKRWTTDVIFASCSFQAAVCRHCLGFCVLLSVFPVVFLGFYFSPLSGELGAASIDMCLYLPEATTVSYLYND